MHKLALATTTAVFMLMLGNSYADESKGGKPATLASPGTPAKTPEKKKAQEVTNGATPAKSATPAHVAEPKKKVKKK